MNSSRGPIPVIPLEYAPPIPRSVRIWRRIGIMLIPAGWLIALAAWILIWTLDVQTVIATGPVLLIAGALLIISGIMTRSPWTIVIGACHCAICLLFFVLVNALRWSPTQADQPFTIMGMIYVILSLLPSVVAWEHRPQ